MRILVWIWVFTYWSHSKKCLVPPIEFVAEGNQHLKERETAKYDMNFNLLLFFVSFTDYWFHWCCRSADIPESPPRQPGVFSRQVWFLLLISCFHFTISIPTWFLSIQTRMFQSWPLSHHVFLSGSISSTQTTPSRKRWGFLFFGKQWIGTS